MSPTHDLKSIDQLPEEIHTPRLFIRTAKPGDGAVFNRAIIESLPRLKPWLGWVSPTPSLDDSEFSCRRAYARFLLNEDLMALFFLKESGQLVGGSGLHSVKWDLRHFEVGYWGHSSFAGQGLICEGVQALTRYAILELKENRVFLTTDEQNVPSRRVAERVGFHLEGVLKNERLNLHGVLRNTCVYAMFADSLNTP